jgi:COMPASS component SWD3
MIETAAQPPDVPDAADPDANATPTYKHALTLHGHTRAVSSLKFSPDGKWLASASSDCTIKLWRVSDGRFEMNFEGHAQGEALFAVPEADVQGISDVAWSSDSAYLCSASDDKTVRIWNVSTVRRALFPPECAILTPPPGIDG